MHTEKIPEELKLKIEKINPETEKKILEKYPELKVEGEYFVFDKNKKTTYVPRRDTIPRKEKIPGAGPYRIDIEEEIARHLGER